MQVNVPSGNDSDEIPPVITALLNSVLVQFVRSEEGEDTVVNSEVVPRDRVEQYLQQVRLAGYDLDDVRFQESAEEQPQDEATRGSSQDIAQGGAEPGEDVAEDIAQHYAQGGADIKAEGDDSEDVTTDPSVLGQVLSRKKNLKKQTKPPYKAPTAQPRATGLVWSEFYPVPLPAPVRGNPGGWEAAHNVIANAKNLKGFGMASHTKTSGPIKSTGAKGKDDWKAGIRSDLLNAWILHKHNKVLFTQGMKDYGAQNEWFFSRSEQERDEFRIWARAMVEAGLQDDDRDEVQRLRNIQQPIVPGSFNASVANGTWTHPTLGGGMGAPTNADMQAMNVAEGGIANDLTGRSGNGPVPGRHARPNTRLGSGSQSNSRRSRKRDREVEDEEDEDNSSRNIQELLRPNKKRRQSVGGGAEIDAQNEIRALMQDQPLLEPPPGMPLHEWYGGQSQATEGQGAPVNGTQRRLPHLNIPTNGSLATNSSFPNEGASPGYTSMTDELRVPQPPQRYGFDEPSTAEYEGAVNPAYPDPSEYEQLGYRYQHPTSSVGRSSCGAESHHSGQHTGANSRANLEARTDHGAGSWGSQEAPPVVEREGRVVTDADYFTSDAQEREQLARITHPSQAYRDRLGKNRLRGG
jgi:hypothetical protein